MASPTKQEDKGKKVDMNLDLLRMQITENPGTILVSNALIGPNSLSWNRSIKIALGPKMKLGFINGKDPKHAETSEEYEHWARTDSGNFLDLEHNLKRYSGIFSLYRYNHRTLARNRGNMVNSPMVYQLQREIVSTSQGTLKYQPTLEN
ncbi:UNVERIFIED_CONTAM: hypothetical protein Slati_0019000 [Sesamum latifolium]|uniref:Retrotransposon Copia-like N-terminal domain-containing protein n=1 Tax=Sesamum latifolium TaxID=2727402 RepID=A0AAW2Y6A8_9LAMI